MDANTFTTVCGIIILIASTLTALVTIVNSVKNPAKKYKERQAQETKELIITTIKEIMPELFLAHDLETRDRYLADRERYLQDIKSEILCEIRGDLSQIKELKKQYEVLVSSAKDVLREKIINIYLQNKDAKQISTLDSERLEQFYLDYKKLGGNSYIDKYYNRMKKWKILEDDYNDSDLI